MSSDSWTQYAEYARRLDAVRAEESARSAGMREAVAQMTTHADELEALLNGQGGMLTRLATTLRFRAPKLTPIAPGTKPEVKREATAESRSAAEAGAVEESTADKKKAIDPATALSELAKTIDRGDAEALAAATRGEYPALIPQLTGTTRNLVFYGIAALLVLGLQVLSFSRTGTETNPIAVLFLIPLVGFGLAYVVLRVGGRTRVEQETPDVSPRLGFLICFLIGPIAAAVVVGLPFLSG